MKVTLEFYKLAALPLGHQPDLVTYDFEARGYSREMISVWLRRGLLTQEQYDELLSRLPPQE